MWQPSAPELKSLCNKSVRLFLTDGTNRFGRIVTIDPITYTIVISAKLDSNEKLDFVLGHAVKDVEVMDGDAQLTTSSTPVHSLVNSAQSEALSGSDLKERKARVIDWFKKQRLPVHEQSNGNLQIFGAVQIEPPYTADTCLCSNQIVLSRVQKIMNSMPHNSS